MEASDAKLLADWRAGDSEAGDALFGRHFSGIFRFFCNKTSDPTAEDVTQKTFMALLGARDEFAGRSSFRTYAFGIARRQLYMHFRRDRVEQRIFDPDLVSVAEMRESPSSIMAAQQEQKLLLLALRRLPLDYQIAVELYYWEGLKVAEVGEVLEDPEGTVRSRLTRARAKLGEIVTELATDPKVADATLRGFESWARSLRRLERT